LLQRLLQHVLQCVTARNLFISTPTFPWAMSYCVGFYHKYAPYLMSTEPFHPYRPVWYVPDQGMDYTILETCT